MKPFKSAKTVVNQSEEWIQLLTLVTSRTQILLIQMLILNLHVHLLSKKVDVQQVLLDSLTTVNVTYIWVVLYDYTKILKNKVKGVNSNNTFATAMDMIEQALQIWKKNIISLKITIHVPPSWPLPLIFLWIWLVAKLIIH